MSTNKRKNLLMIALVFCCCLISVGYFTIISKSVIEGRVKFEQGEWSVKFTGIRTARTYGNASNYENPNLSSYLISFYALFKEVGDSITYDVDVTNDGTLDAKLLDINFITSMSNAVTFEYDGIELGTVLKSGETKTFQVTVTYTDLYKYLESNNEDNVMKLLLNWGQAN